MKQCKACGKVSKDESKFYPTRHGGLLGGLQEMQSKVQVMAARATSSRRSESTITAISK